MSIPQDDLGKEVIEIVGIHQPTPLHRKQKLHREYHAEYWPLIACSERMLNAGVDVNNFEPVTFDEMVENNNRQKIAWREQQEDNHGSEAIPPVG